MKKIRITAREWEIMRLISEGNVNKEIAAIQDCSEFTVRNRITGLFRKFDGVRFTSRIELGILYILKTQKPPRKEKGYPGRVIAALAELEAD